MPLNQALIPVTAVMSSPVWSLTPETSVVEALQFAEEHAIHHLPLVEHAQAVGFVCTCDLQEVSLRGPVSRVMRKPVTIDQTQSCEAAAQVMDREKVGSVLVTSVDGVVGIVTREDLLQSDTTSAENATWHCACCGSVQHLRTRSTGVTLCTECLQRSAPPVPEDELGGGD